jgi:hypothetical protein
MPPTSAASRPPHCDSWWTAPGTPGSRGNAAGVRPVTGIKTRGRNNSEFTRFNTFAKLTVPPGTDSAKARELPERAEHGCLVANSLRGTRSLDSKVVQASHQSAKGHKGKPRDHQPIRSRTRGLHGERRYKHTTGYRPKIKIL